MKRITIQEPLLNPTFIGSWIIEPTSLCENLIDYFESKKKEQSKGATSSGVNKKIKDSTDMTIHPKDILLPGNEIFNQYFKELFECHKDYISQWSFLKNNSEKFEIGVFNLQRYKAGQHFKKIHTERFAIEHLHRVFVFMTYLNDVQDGGSTYFSHYDLEIQPRKGLTLIWPAEWTHAHRGNILKAGNKYIITGWINFTN
tara:strand:+ start:2621 stop:3220 length:600 start_codon:yes stop_codon:yes gene_type:complete